MVSDKDSAEVIKFMTLFVQLKDCCDDDPQCLFDLAENDEGVKSLCIELGTMTSLLSMNERRQRALFAAPVDPKFRTAWRDFEDRFAKPVARIWLSRFDSFRDLRSTEVEQTSEADLQWDNADYDGHEQARAIESAIELTHERLSGLSGDLQDKIEDGIAAWERLKYDTEFDLQGVFRRRELVPFVLVPRHVALKYGDAEPLSMLNKLRQAHDAFVFGVPYAALALMRSITEVILRDHYGAEGEDLKECINQASKRLPSGAGSAALHRLRRLANAILHPKPDRNEALAKIKSMQLEKEIVSLLFVLRELIEERHNG